EGHDCRNGSEHGDSEKASSKWQLHEFISDLVIIVRANDAGSMLSIDAQTFARNELWKKL
ncbi:hypothetical protein, partial [Pseudomonas syringae]|uniref:hypothetical protein n=1 Tax=Pseudomonas syringae TaxID=317 RepID=UPI001F38DFAD